MSAIVGIDAKIQISTDNGVTWQDLPERNQFSISISVDSAEHKVFVQDLASAWVEKQRTWMSWSGSLDGYFDDADDTIFNTMVQGKVVLMRFYTSRASNKVWEGKALLTNVEHETGTEDFATLSVDFEGVGKLERKTLTQNP